MTNDTTFGLKKNSTPSIMEPIDETPSLTLTVWYLVSLCKYTYSKSISKSSFSPSIQIEQKINTFVYTVYPLNPDIILIKQITCLSLQVVRPSEYHKTK